MTGPANGIWSSSTIHGNPERGVGILNNELYIGRLVWNRLRYLRAPDSGKRVSRPNPASEWFVTDVPALRIVPDELWARVKRRQAAIRELRNERVCEQRPRLVGARRPKYLFSGLTRCAVCGGGVHVYSGSRLACYASRGTGTCSNRLTIRREEVETRVLTALREQLLNRELFEEFCREFAQEMNRLQGAERARQSSIRQELAAVNRDVAKLIEAIKNDVPVMSLKDELIRLEGRKGELERSVQANPELRPLLHPGMADLRFAQNAKRSNPSEMDETGAFDIFGCGGPQPTLLAILARSGMTTDHPLSSLSVAEPPASVPDLG